MTTYLDSKWRQIWQRTQLLLVFLREPHQVFSVAARRREPLDEHGRRKISLCINNANIMTRIRGVPTTYSYKIRENYASLPCTERGNWMVTGRYIQYILVQRLVCECRHTCVGARGRNKNICCKVIINRPYFQKNIN